MVTLRLTPPKKIVWKLSVVLGIVAIIVFVIALTISLDWILLPPAWEFADWFIFTLAFHIMLVAFGLICAGAAFKGF